MSTRIYLVEMEANKETRLVEAVSQWQAIRHVCRNYFKARAANAKDVARIVGSGGKVESAVYPDAAAEVTK